MTTPNITAIAPWYGSNRSLAHEVGPRLCTHHNRPRWIGIPFAGGMCELTSIMDTEQAPRTIVVSDLHAHVVNLASVIADDKLNPRLRQAVHDLPHDDGVLRDAQERCIDREKIAGENWFGGQTHVYFPDLDWAIDYFVSVWMARSGTAGTKKEFEAKLSVRYDAGGGDSATRLRNATSGLEAWQQIMRRCTFRRVDVFVVMEEYIDHRNHGVYVDPPFPEVGANYKHTFTEADQRRLAAKLASFKHMKVLARYYDHPLIRELYPADSWLWEPLSGGKTQHNAEAPEVLISRRVK